jgi:predicted O-linked N-acetylglucosamine transferase (SPINDLY family)
MSRNSINPDGVGMKHARKTNGAVAEPLAVPVIGAQLRNWSLVELFTNAESLAANQDAGSSAILYKSWIAYNPDHPGLHAAYFNYAIALANSGDRLGAINALRECIRIKPDFAPSYINLGRVLEDGGDTGLGVLQWIALINQMKGVDGDSVKHKLLALQQIGRVLEAHEQDVPAEDALRQALDINPAQPEVIQHYIALRQRQCKWPAIGGSEYIPAKVLVAGISPLSLANLIDDPLFQLARAYKYSRELVKEPQASGRHWTPPAVTGARSKLRIGYVSSDLREHAVGFAMADTFEQHDRDSFEIHAYYCGINRVDPTRLRIKAASDSWTDINGLSDEQAAEKIAKDKIDILVDLNGYTKDARAKVFALRPAPIIVNWMGFPGTTGSPYHHYIIADEHIIPKEHEIYFSEKVVRLPCYQPNDRKRVVADQAPSPADEGLPADSFVFCCLNGTQKIIPQVFSCWMQILAAVPSSVLWLLSGTGDTNERLKQLAAQSGVAPERLIFAQKKPNPEHLARYALADLFLDTFPYGAHTTASDAMWMGVPVLTVCGRGFASRVCASLVKAAGIGDLVCSDHNAYVGRAIELGRNPKSLERLKKKLKAGRGSCLLFNTPLLVEELEKQYRGMWDEYRRGTPPKPNLVNMDAYNEIAIQLYAGNAGAMSHGETDERYRKELEIWNDSWGLQPDQRLWQE